MVLADDDERPRRPVAFQPAVLDGKGVEELRDYIAALTAEIARAEQAIASREAQRSAAEAFFRKG